MPTTNPPPRMVALDLLSAVLRQKRRLDKTVSDHPVFAGLDSRDRAFVRVLAATTLRRLGQIDAFIDFALEKPLPRKASGVHDLLRLGICQIIFLETPAHAAVATAVDLAQDRGFGAYKKLVNAVLRRIGREGAEMIENQDAALEIGGPEFQVGQQVRVRLGNLAVPVRFVGITTHFPTLIPDRKPFFIVDLTDFQEYARRLPSSILDEPNEMWLAIDEDADRSQIILQIAEAAPGLITIRDGETAAAFAERNPLAGGGWDGLTIFSMAAIGIAVLLTLTVHSLVSIRTGRMDLAVARALGFSSRQFFLSLAAERMIIAVLALAAGATMGYWPGLEILELVDLTPQGDAPVPPLLPSVKGWLMAGVLAGLLGAAILSVGFAVVAARRLNTAEVLRGGI